MPNNEIDLEVTELAWGVDMIYQLVSQETFAVHDNRSQAISIIALLHLPGSIRQIFDVPLW